MSKVKFTSVFYLFWFIIPFPDLENMEDFCFADTCFQERTVLHQKKEKERTVKVSLVMLLSSYLLSFPYLVSLVIVFFFSYLTILLIHV